MRRALPLRARSEVILERVEAGPGRRSLPLPVNETYSLTELIPNRQEGPHYRVPGEIGQSLAGAFGRALGVIERAYGTLRVQSPSKILTPGWQRLFHHLARRGLARTVTLSSPHERGLSLYYFDVSAHFSRHLTDGGQPDPLRYSRGFSEDYDHALAKAAGECLERGTLLYFQMEDMVRSDVRALRSRGAQFVAPERVGVFSDEQKRMRRGLAFDDDSVFMWTRCRSVLSDDEALLPSQLVHWNYPVAWGDVPEPMLREINTNGAGAYYSLEGAILSGLLECVQRDGFFLYWLRGLTPRRIDASGLRRPATLRLLEEARDLGLEPVFLDVTSELGIPTCVCILLRGDEELPCASMGGSSRLDGEVAMHDALLEAASVHHLLIGSSERLRLPEGYEPWGDASFDSHKRIAFWANPEHKRHLAFLLEGEPETVTEFRREPLRGGDVRRTLEHVVSVLRSAGMDAWCFQAQHEALDEVGYASVRVIVPDLLPMYCENYNAPLGHRRLTSAPLPSGHSRPGPLPPWPHPFP
jgi:ribosomal protein S12 methylthiotransferase accessory factor